MYIVLYGNCECYFVRGIYVTSMVEVLFDLVGSFLSFEGFWGVFETFNILGL